jgi:hypothetical protein
MITWSLDFAAMYDIAIGVFGMSSATMPCLAIEPISKSISDLKGSIITRLQGRLDISDVAARVIHKVPKQHILAFSITPVRMGSHANLRLKVTGKGKINLRLKVIAALTWNYFVSLLLCWPQFNGMDQVLRNWRTPTTLMTRLFLMGK